MPALTRKRNFYHHRDTVCGHFQHSKLSRRFEDVKLAQHIAAILSPVLLENGISAPVEAAQCEIKRKFKKIRLEDLDPEEEFDPFSAKEVIQINLHLKSTADLTRYTQIKPSLDRALTLGGCSAYELNAVCDPRAYKPLDPLVPRELKVRRPCSEEGSEAAAQAASELPEDSPLRESLLALAAVLKPKA